MSAAACTRALPPFFVRTIAGSRSRSRALIVTRNTMSNKGSGGTDADETSAASPEATVRRSGRCFCGKVAVTLTGAPTAVSICHCVNCRKLSGAPFTAQALVRAAQVEVTRDDGVGELVGYASSPAVERFRCPTCMSPVYASLSKGKMAAVPLSVLDDRSDDGGEGGEGGGTTTEQTTAPMLRATHHMYYSDRIIDVPDHLPKYVKSAGGKQAELWTPAAE